MSRPLEPELSADPVAADLPVDLTLACSRFTRLAVRRADVGVSSVTWRLASTLERHGELRLRDIAALDQVTRPTATAVVRRLEEEGLIARRADPLDSRSWFVRLTDAGRARLLAWRSRLGSEVGDLLVPLEAEELETLRRATTILGRLVDAADAELGAPPPRRSSTP